MLNKTSNLSVLLVLAWLTAPAPSPAQIEPPVYLGRDDRPLSIQDDEEILAFLRTARETASEPIGEGITEAYRLTLVSADSIEARAAFHHVNHTERKIKRLPNNNVVGYLRDSYTSQVAAYRVGRLLGMDNIPPTVLRRSNHLNGSAQLWIEKAMTEKVRQERGIKPVDRTIWNQLYADMRVFDNLINNIDRNTGNMLVDSFGRLWLIDHTRSFGRDKSLPRPETITRCSHRLYEAIKGLDEAVVESALEELMSKGEIKAIFKRRLEVLEKLDHLIAKLGPDQVLFDYGDPDPGIRIVGGDGE